MSDRVRLRLTPCGSPDHLHLSITDGLVILTVPVTDQELRPFYEFLCGYFEEPSPQPAAPSVGGPPDSRQGPEATSTAGCSNCGHKTMLHGIGGCYHVDHRGEVCTCPRGAAEIVRGRR